jgi:hypothetical protein
MADSLDEAQRLFYSGQYQTAAVLALNERSTDSRNLSASELRSSALLFQIRREMGDATDRDKAWKACSACQELMSAFLTEITHGRTMAKARLAAKPDDEDALFFLGKLDLNYVWLYAGTLGKKTGWSEYWEARKSLDAVLKANPGHVRARVARAWIDYIVDTKLPRMTRWMLGGGNKKRGMLAVEEAARLEAEPYAQAEARFALWDMQVRERNIVNAVATARDLSRDFPENRELVKFLNSYDLRTSR